MSAMESQQERIAEAYRMMKESDEHEYQRVVFESPNNKGWAAKSGYVTEAEISGEAAVKVVREDKSFTIPFNRVIRVETTEKDD